MAKRKKGQHRDRAYNRATGERGTIVDVYDKTSTGVPNYGVIPDTGQRRQRLWRGADVDWEPPNPKAPCPRCKEDGHDAINCPNGDCGHPPSILFTGKNTVEVRDWVNKDSGRAEGESWFMTRGMSASTGNQAWNYAKDGRKWGEDVAACVYDPRSERWEPMRKGDYIERQGDGYAVRRPG